MGFLLIPVPFTKIKVSIAAMLLILALFYADASVFTFEVLLSAAIHEMGHIIAMKMFGVKIHSVTVMPCGAEIMSDVSLLPYKKEAIVALSGALANVVTGLASYTVFLFSKDIYSLFFAVSSVFLAFVNLVPAKSLDGAVALEAYLCSKYDCEKSEHILSAVSFASFVLLVTASIFLVWVTGGNFSLLIFCVYLFICTYSGSR